MFINKSHPKYDAHKELACTLPPELLHSLPTTAVAVWLERLPRSLMETLIADLGLHSAIALRCAIRALRRWLFSRQTGGLTMMSLDAELHQYMEDVYGGES